MILMTKPSPATKGKRIAKCTFCDKSQEYVKKLVSGPGKSFICNECVDLFAHMLEDIDTDIQVAGKHAIPTPMEIHQDLNEFVIGQEDAKKTLAVAAYNHYKRITLLQEGSKTKVQKSNILILGPSGTGKTHLAQTMAKLLKVPFAIADATTLTEAGYVGEDVESVLHKLLLAADFDIEQAQRGIVFIDEIDKISRSTGGTSNRKDVGGESVQQALLKMIEGTAASVPRDGGHKRSETNLITIDTTNILFICGGAFDGINKIIDQRLNKKAIGFGATLNSTADNVDIAGQVDTEDLQKYGLIPEIIGRLPIIVSLSPLGEGDLVSILTEPKDAIIEQYKHLLEIDGVTLEFTDDAITAIAKQAIARKTGARGLRTIIEGFMKDIMYEIPSKKRINKIIITKETVTDKKSPKISYKRRG